MSVASSESIIAGPLKLLFVLPNFGRNGAVDFIVDLAGAIASDDCDVDVVALNGPLREGRLPMAPVRTAVAAHGESDTLKNDFIPGSLRRIGRILRQFSALIRHGRQVDVIVLTWEKGLALNLPSLAAFLLRKPTIAILQNNIEQSLNDYTSNGAFWKNILRRTYARALAVVCVSYDLTEIAARLGVSQDKIVAIPNAVDVERVRSLAKQPPPGELDFESQPTIVSIGRLSRQKGFDILIPAHAKVVRGGIRHKLILIGNGPDRQELMDIARDEGVSESVIFLGYQANPYSVLSSASLCCMSSRYEGRSLVLAEASLLGVPIIATDCPTGPREVLEDGRYGDLVESESIDALALAIDRHFCSPQLLMEKAQAASIDSRRLSIDRCAERFVDLIRGRLAADPPSLNCDDLARQPD